MKIIFTIAALVLAAYVTVSALALFQLYSGESFAVYQPNGANY